MDNEMTTRDQRVPILLTKEEKDRMQKAADKVGVGLSTYIRIKVLEALPDEQ